jgi:hypothetical protein
MQAIFYSNNAKSISYNTTAAGGFGKKLSEMTDISLAISA